MIHQQRTPLQRLLSNFKATLLCACLLVVLVSAKPLTSGKNPDTLQLSPNNALAPKSTENKREIDSAAAAAQASAPLSPEHERARELWNKAKKLQHQSKPRRYVRNVPRYERNVAVDNATNVPKYILELYKNLTEQSTTEKLQQSTQANTVRSLQTVNNDAEKCKIFNFSLSSINSSEYIVKAELRVSLTQVPSTLSNVVITIKSANTSETTSWTIRSDISVERQRKYVFDVAGILSPWVRNGASYAEFEILFSSDFSDSTFLDCPNDVHFYHLSDNEDDEPLLVVHSYDSEVDNFDYQKVLDTVTQNKTTTERRRRASENSHRISRRTTETIPFCDVISLNITRDEIPKKDRDESIFMPTLYNAGICGGNCGNTMPQEQNLGHNVLIHMLQASSSFRERHGYHITRCCAPIKYAPLEVIVVPPPIEKKSAYIRIIPNMKIVQCECLEIVDYNSSR